MQLSMQAEALRRQIGGLRVDLTIYCSSLAFMDDPRVVRWTFGLVGRGCDS